MTVSTDLNDKQWKVMVSVFCDAPLHTSLQINGEIDLILRVENHHYIMASEKVSLSPTSEQREVTVNQILTVPKVIPLRIQHLTGGTSSLNAETM